MKTIKPILTSTQKANILGKNVASSAGIIVTSFRRLQLEVAKLSCLNMRYVLYFRGQGHDYKSGKKSDLYPTMYRGTMSKTIRESRWNNLEKACELLVNRLSSSGIDSQNIEILKRKPLLQWSILQHYEVVATPLIDVTQSLRVACTFAQMDCKDGETEAYVYVVALPYVSHRIHVDSEEYMTVIRLLSIAPPNALRPYCQDGFLVGEDVIQEKYYDKKELNLSRRLVAKFKIPANGDSGFWDTESPVDRNILYPTSDEMLDICNGVKKELEIWSNNNKQK